MIKNNKITICYVLMMLLLFTTTGLISAKEDSEKEPIFIQAHNADGKDQLRYIRSTGVMSSDLTSIAGAYWEITSDDVVITGKVIELKDEEQYLKVTIDAKLIKDDITVTADQIEYFSEENMMIAIGNVVAKTENGIIYAQKMVYLEDEDIIDFHGQLYGEF